MVKEGEGRGSGDELTSSLRARENWAQDLLCRLISIPSATGGEARVQAFLFDFLSQTGFEPKRSPVADSIIHDPDYAHPAGRSGFLDRPNILLTIPGSGGGRSAVINTHTDVVPAPPEMFSPRVEGEVVCGRGACDAKGQVVTALLALRALRDRNIRLKGNVEVQFVIEEETGGTGSLALLAGGSRADMAVVLEPTGLGVRAANRGAAWFRLSVSGRPAHMGRYHEGVNAVDEMTGLIAVLKEYESRLRDASKGYPGFPDDPSPVVVNIGEIRGGEWPSTLPGECVLKGGIAFLPNRTSRQVEQEVRDLIQAKATPWSREHSRFELSGLRNEAFETPTGNPAVQFFSRAAAEVLGPHPLEGWAASCDARLFFHRGGMPVLVFGPGDLRQAHSLDERVAMGDILRGAEVLARFLAAWCGLEGKEGTNAG